MNGICISLEGIDGSGKTSQVRRLADALRAMGHDVLVTREPGGSPAGEAIRALLVQGAPDSMSDMTEVLLFAAARVEHIRKTIRPAIEAGLVVITDRSLGSTLAYQSAGGEVGRAQILSIHNTSTGGFRPDLSLLLDVPVDLGLSRSLKRLASAGSAEDRFEKKGRDYFERVRDGFLQTCRSEPGWRLVDASGDEESVHRSILADVKSILR